MAMDPQVMEWLNLLFRWLHVITGVAWIGASFYFIWLDNNLRTPPQWKQDKGIRGDLWAIHGGGFYEIAKYQLAPEEMPEQLHWFKWEAYTTWLTGFCLLTLIYYFNAEVYLIDKSVAELSILQAIVIGIGALLIGFIIYEMLCRSPLGNNGYLLGALLFITISAFAYGLTELFSARGAYMHVGALIGTIMAGNVFFGIIPAQKALVSAVKQGGIPDPNLGLSAKLRSTHNNYMTLPLLFIMISAHYPMIYGHHYNWAILSALAAISAFARHYFNLKHRGMQKPIILVIAFIAFVALATVISLSNQPAKTEAPTKDTAVNHAPVSFSAVNTIIQQRCSTCHSATPTDDVFLVAPGGVMLDSVAQIKQFSQRIRARSVDTQTMPLANKTQMTQQERDTIKHWLEQQ